MHIPRSRAYSQLWRVVDGAVRDALENHDDYLTPKGKRNARASITKRVTGAVLGFAEESVKSRSGVKPAADNGAAAGNELRVAAFITGAAWRAVSQWAARLFGFGEKSP